MQHILFTITCTSTADIDLEPQKITILQTADIHGQVYPHSELFFNEGEISYKTLGGLANMKTLFNEERSLNPIRLFLMEETSFKVALAALSEGSAFSS